MSAAGELRLRGMFGTGFVTFHWQVCYCVDLFESKHCLRFLRLEVELWEMSNVTENRH